jgi:hypothetical protein
MKKLKFIILTLVIISLISTPTLAVQKNNDFSEIEKFVSGDVNIGFEIITEGLNSPVVLAHPGDGLNRIFIGDQIGIIYVIENDILLEIPFLDLTDKIVELSGGYDERGLLGITFHPDYENNGKFYVYYSAPKTGPEIDHESILAEYSVSLDDPNIADPDSENIIYKVDQPESNHNGGQIEFGPDGYLYIGLGDGGGAGDIHGIIGNGQDINSSLGSILRIDVDGGSPYVIPFDNPFVGIDGLDEIYAYGFRNPWKFSFDSESGELFVADVGQDLWEEIDIVLNGGNYGWRIMEGTHFYDEDLLDFLGLTIDDLEMPIHEYSHDLGKSITGGYVYRKNPDSSLYGKYIFGDWSSAFVPPSGRLFYLEEIALDTWERYNLLVGGSNNINRYLLSFGEDESGNIYVLSKTSLGPTGTTGDVRRMIPDNQPPTKPTIKGPIWGKVGVDYEYTFLSCDPEGEDLYYFIDWGDGESEEWIGPFSSGEEVIVNHTFTKKGFLIIKAKAKDTNNAESLVTSYLIRMPKSLKIAFFNLFERFSNMFPVLKIILTFLEVKIFN